MGQRIRQLEDAIAIFQAGVSNECHPLLREEFLSIKFGPEIKNLPTHQSSHHPIDDSSMDALGTLTISDHGESYYGRSAGSEVSDRSPLIQFCLDGILSLDTSIGNMFNISSGLVFDDISCIYRRARSCNR